jgi:hypothetical protein
LSKCAFGQHHIEYLGHIISAQRVSTDPSKIQAVRDCPTPTNITELHGFLGLAGYYRRFIKDYGKICKPLFEGLKKGEFTWSTPQSDAFNNIKTTSCSAPVLALPDFSKPFILEADASDNSIGAVLMQEGKPLSFLSKQLGKNSSELSTHEKEAMTIIEALKKWKHYLSEATLILRTDEESLKYMGEQRLVQGIEHKLMVKLMSYNYKIKNKKGKENRAADALSRRPQTDHIMPISTTVPLWINDVLSSYAQDEKCREIETQLRINPAAVPNITLKNGIIRYKTRIYVGSNSDPRKQLIASFHDSALGGHSGDIVTYIRLKALFH